MSCCSHWRIWLPAIVASMCFATRALPTTTTTERPEARSISLPPVHGMRTKPRLRRFELRADNSSVRFHVREGHQQAIVECGQLRGDLQLGPKPDEGSLTLRLDLSSLRSLPRADSETSIPAVLEALGKVEFVYHGKMVAVASSDLPGITQTSWLGRIQFDSRVIAQPIQLWRCELPGRAMRLQGQGVLATDALGAQTRATFGLLDAHDTITLGLDLAWKPVRD